MRIDRSQVRFVSSHWDYNERLKIGSLGMGKEKGALTHLTEFAESLNSPRQIRTRLLGATRCILIVLVNSSKKCK